MNGKIFMKKQGHFTLVELMLAMSIFAVLMLILMQIFGSTQDVWRKTGAKADSYESARIALNLIAEDLANAVYVEDVKGKSFHCCDNQLWFVTKKPYTIEDGQKSLVVEVKYRMRAYESAEITADNVPSGLTLNKLEYYITTDSSSASDYDFKTKTDAQKTPSSPTSLRGILLENVLAFSVIPLYIKVSGGTPNSYPCSKYLPNMVMVSLTVLDDDNTVRNRYKSATAADKKQISRTFIRVIPIKRGQTYDISTESARNKLKASAWTDD